MFSLGLRVKTLVAKIQILHISQGNDGVMFGRKLPSLDTQSPFLEHLPLIDLFSFEYFICQFCSDIAMLLDSPARLVGFVPEPLPSHQST